MTDSAALLKRLSPAVAPLDSPHAPPARTGIESCNFEQLLHLASSGALSSEEPIEVAAGLQQALDPAQLQRLASAADLARRHGARQAIVLIDERALLLDVDARVVTSEMAADNTDALHLVDAVVRMGDDEAGGERSVHRSTLDALPPRGVTEQIELARGSLQSGDAPSSAPLPGRSQRDST